MDVSAAVETLRQGQSPAFPPEAKKRGFAEKLDAQDELGHLREQFVLPTRGSLKKKALKCTWK
jgi:kynureninase